jgi:hypothetical protein
MARWKNTNGVPFGSFRRPGSGGCPGSGWDTNPNPLAFRYEPGGKCFKNLEETVLLTRPDGSFRGDGPNTNPKHR